MRCGVMWCGVVWCGGWQGVAVAHQPAGWPHSQYNREFGEPSVRICTTNFRLGVELAWSLQHIARVEQRAHTCACRWARDSASGDVLGY